MKPYVVWSPPYDNASGGIVVMHRMAVELMKRGLTVFINTEKQNPKSPRVPVLESNTLQDSIAIYPEIVWGNPFESKTVVRYLLNVPGVCGGPSSIHWYPNTDFFFVFSETYNKKIGLPEECILFCPHLELDVFYNKYLKRSGRLVYRGKGKHPDDARANHPLLGGKESFRGDGGQQKLADALNKCELLYCYDNCTAIIDISRLCGCPVVIIPDGSYTKEQSSDSEYYKAGGVGWGIEEAAVARATINSEKVREAYIREEIVFQNKLTRFIELTQGV